MIDLEQRIADLPAQGGAGLAIKAYLLLYWSNAGSSNAERDHPGRASANGDFGPHDGAILRDAARFVPEIAELLASGRPEITEDQRADLRARAEAIAAEFDVDTLPPGDAGLIEAERRLPLLRAQEKALYREFSIDCKIEDTIINPTTNAAECALEDFIENTPLETREGALVKLRYMRGYAAERAWSLEEDDSILAQVLAYFEREARQ